ncbi:molybdate ABC transporter permease subunit [Anaerococcus sp. AGMB00486]|uniref:Molybdenum transport system permease n=1 Tax=Anaerococcus faecalis TaxID=2742993 RepID=A0ABX2NCA6_9FIRM|nr:molybdate ABC transporter permease subunit [Anaerococcus faecalis]NVF12332.1 molybdate ABC transporter permease subunit [Anaerococcus faecalis]
MDLFPLYNSVRIALISSVIIFFLGIFAAYYIRKLPAKVKGVIDVILTLPLVLPPTVVGFFLIKILGPNSSLGSTAIDYFNLPLIMNWYSAIFATVIVTFPLMYRTTRGAFEAYNENLSFAAQTLGKSNTWIFRKIILPNCKKGVMAGLVLSFARALGEYGATSMVSGYTPGKTATISTSVYQYWRIGQDELAYKWVLINVLISFVVLVAINFLEDKTPEKKEMSHA